MNNAPCYSTANSLKSPQSIAYAPAPLAAVTAADLRYWYVGIDRPEVYHGRTVTVTAAPLSPKYATATLAEKALALLLPTFPDAYVWECSFLAGAPAQFERITKTLRHAVDPAELAIQEGA